MMDFVLENLGLSKTEVKAYLSLLSLRSVPASTLARHLKIPRSTAKYTCEQLAQKGIVEASQRGNTWYYTPRPPQHLQFLLEKDRQIINTKEKQLQQIIKNLDHLYVQETVTPSLQSFEGVEGVIQMLDDVLKEKKPLYGALALPEEMHPKLSDYLNEIYIPARKKDPFPAHMIFNDNPRSKSYQEEDQKMNRVSLLMPESKYPFDICFHIYGDKVAFYSYQMPFLSGVILQDKHIQKMQSSLFKMAWNYARLLKINSTYKNINLDL